MLEEGRCWAGLSELDEGLLNRLEWVEADMHLPELWSWACGGDARCGEEGEGRREEETPSHQLPSVLHHNLDSCDEHQR